MDSLLNKLKNKDIWNEYLQYKTKQQFLSIEKQEKLKKYIENNGFFELSNKIAQGKYQFSFPQKHLINKVNKVKKRVIYTLEDEEMLQLKVINYLVLKEYDNIFCKNCYSFRKDYGVKQAIHNITSISNINELCGYKIDIENYFNSVKINKLLPKLKEIFAKDELLYEMFESLLKNKYVKYNEEVIEEEKGIMAGIPISSFLANVYLMEMDKFFEKENIVYARYSDDIILFGKENQIQKYQNLLDMKIEEYELTINESKKEFTKPNEKWCFLGILYENGKIDLSPTTKKKIKGKIRRAARKIRRWMLKKEVPEEKAIKVMNRKFNKKFYGIKQNDNTELTWARWFFPIINTVDGLKEIDHYMQQYLRYIITGRHTKKNFNISYNFLKECNYIPLVRAYYNREYINFNNNIN